jgi:hypothetical protein
MRATEALIEEIVAASQIPSGKRRREVMRELRSHVEDFVLIARRAGQTDDEIERMVLANFGDPRQIGLNFARVYRRERTVLRFSVFALCTLAVASLISAAVLAMQTCAAIGFGVPIQRVLGTRHTMIEAFDILATVAGYVGFISLENLFDRRRFQKAIALLSVIFAILICGSVGAGVRAPFLIFGFANAIFLRTVQEFLRSWTARLGAALVYFELFGVILIWVRSPGYQYSVSASLTSWMVMGVGYQLMTGLAARIDRELFNRLQQF